MDFIFLKK